jgi:uncharacterized protein
VTLIGLISDTHGLLRPDIAGVFAGVSKILHAGDVGGASILTELARIAPVEAVYGNVDDPHDPMLLRERSLTVAGISIHLSHGHELGSPTAERMLARYDADVVVFGHTHKAVVTRGAAIRTTEARGFNHRLAVNPGAAGPRRFDLLPSVALLEIEGGKASVQIISLPV